MMENIVLVCENSLEGVFSGIFEAYAGKYEHDRCYLQVGEEANLRLFTQYHEVPVDENKAARVVRTMIREFGQETYYTLCQALATQDADRGDAVYHTIVCGLKAGKRFQLMNYLGVSCVTKVFELSRYAQNEILHLKGFLRFQELENGVLFARIGPRNNIVTFLAPHFADRFPRENFVIYDEERKIFVIHPASRPWTVVTGEALNEDMMGRLSDQEKEYQELFCYFCEKIAIKERINLHLQRQMLPLRFQDFMVEFQKSI